MSTIMRKMNIVSRCESTYRTRESGENLPGIFHSYVLAICHMPGASQDKIVKHLCVNKSSVTRHLSKLEEWGYIERRHSEEDKREILVYPTQKMLDIHPEVVRITMEWNSLISEGIPEEEMAVFQSVLDKLIERSVAAVFPEDVR